MVSLSQDAFWSHLYTLGYEQQSCTNLLTKASFSCQPLIFSYLALIFFFVLTPKMQLICEITVIAASLSHGQGA